MPRRRPDAMHRLRLEHPGHTLSGYRRMILGRRLQAIEALFSRYRFVPGSCDMGGPGTGRKLGPRKAWKRKPRGVAP
jgi:hypothetical protein